ncbi:protein-L-isoaspartate O-methyltransferase [Azovibrio restrictus]|uniref:protein-L-isoaspartate O-methyltransferase family protein n=1 Tax=Azovibrio restrictus TaxID=146938 RepID=UPI0026F29F38|nr:protein-L-isoaspartate O-methyltransferase [Azovibrio restrictus]MDD3483669.1 protein-L-isoaspartate O-methyltransferase [Azovibrio restrictus]
MNIEQARFNMVEQQIRPWDVLDQSVLDLLFTVKREEFVPAASKSLAFVDLELPLGQGQVMLAPRVEARLLQELSVRPTDKVLEIGTGSGYMAALLAAKAEHVVSVEINAELADVARGNLTRAGITNVTVETADGARGLAARGPYDVIVISGGVPAIPEAILKQLRVGGRLAAIVGTAPVMRAQLVTCTAEGIYNTVNMFETVVPMLENFCAEPAFSF